jgi:hypothetical protein
MNLYDRLKDKETLNTIKGNYDKINLIDQLSKYKYIHQIRYYDITSLWWAYNPNSNKIDMEKIQQLFED